MGIKILIFSKYFIITFILTFFFILLKKNNFILADQIERVETIYKVKKKLSILLDSLELEKQTRIRSDQSFEDLEYECRKIRDSINTMKMKVIFNNTDIKTQKSKEPIKKNYSLNLFLKTFIKPKNALDWVILIIGSITFLSVIVLLIGIGVTFFSNLVKKLKTPYIKKEKKPSLPQSVLSFSESPGTTSDSLIDMENKHIDNLRKKINNDNKSLKQFNTNLSPFPSSDLPGENTEYYNKGLNISEKIVNAANEGLTLLEISRKYHISVNKVSLILHIQSISKLKKS